jgi:hypothetical protein
MYKNVNMIMITNEGHIYIYIYIYTHEGVPFSLRDMCFH